MKIQILGLCLLATRVVQVSCLGPIDALKGYPQLSTLNAYLNTSSSLTNLLGNGNDFTFLAPSNDAFTKFLTRNNTAATLDLIDATLQYHLLKGNFPALSFSETPQFAVSNLVNRSYTNVTAGQSVELVLGSSGQPEFVSGNKSISTTSVTNVVCTGGVIHIIDEMLVVPYAAVSEISIAPFNYFISILSTGGYLDTADAGFVDQPNILPDVTFFVPNSPEALASFTNLSTNASSEDLEAIYQYHFVPNFIGYSTDLKDGMSLKTAQGNNITITIQGNKTFVNAVEILSVDYLVGNGVIHVIDTFLNRFDNSPPPKPTTSAVPSTSTPTSASTSTPTPSTAPGTDNKSTSTVGIPVGVTLGVVALAVLAGAFIWWKKRKGNRTSVGDPTVTGFPSSVGSGKFYVQRGHVQRHDDLALGLESETHEGIRPYSTESSNKTYL